MKLRTQNINVKKKVAKKLHAVATFAKYIPWLLINKVYSEAATGGIL